MENAFTKRHQQLKGFSILEVLFATVILLVGLVAVVAPLRLEPPLVA